MAVCRLSLSLNETNTFIALSNLLLASSTHGHLVAFSIDADCAVHVGRECRFLCRATDGRTHPCPSGAHTHFTTPTPLDTRDARDPHMRHSHAHRTVERRVTPRAAPSRGVCAQGRAAYRERDLRNEPRLSERSHHIYVQGTGPPAARLWSAGVGLFFDPWPCVRACRHPLHPSTLQLSI